MIGRGQPPGHLHEPMTVMQPTVRRSADHPGVLISEGGPRLHLIARPVALRRCYHDENGRERSTSAVSAFICGTGMVTCPSM
jgi:hypothetical protein